MGERRDIEINYDQLRDVIVAHLYAVGYLNDNEEVRELEIEGVCDEDGITPDTVKLMTIIDLRFARKYRKEVE